MVSGMSIEYAHKKLNCRILGHAPLCSHGCLATMLSVKSIKNISKIPSFITYKPKMVLTKPEPGVNPLFHEVDSFANALLYSLNLVYASAVTAINELQYFEMSINSVMGVLFMMDFAEQMSIGKLLTRSKCPRCVFDLAASFSQII